MDKTYLIIESDSDGNTYQIHKELNEAQKAFEGCKGKGVLWGEGTIYLVEVNAQKWGFDAKGKLFGAEIIKEQQFNI